MMLQRFLFVVLLSLMSAVDVGVYQGTRPHLDFRRLGRDERVCLSLPLGPIY